MKADSEMNLFFKMGKIFYNHGKDAKAKKLIF